MTPERLKDLRGLGDPRGMYGRAIIELADEVERLQGALVAVGVEVLVDAARQHRTKGHGRPERSS